MKKCLNMQHIKVIGFACVILLNIAWCGLVKNTLVQGILGFFGSMSIPLFLFAVNEGMKKTRNLTKYMVRVLVLAVVSAAPYYFIYHDFLSDRLQFGSYLSSPFTVFFCMGGFVLYDRIQNNTLKWVSVIFCCLVSWFFGVELAPFSVIIGYMIHIYDEKPNYRDYNITMFMAVIAVVSGVFLFSGSGENKGELIKNISFLGMVLALPIIRMYNGEKGTVPKLDKLMKWTFYVAYPALLCLILVTKLLLAKNN